MKIWFVVQHIDNHVSRYEDVEFDPFWVATTKAYWRACGGRVLAIVRPKRTLTSRHLEYRTLDTP